MSKIHQVQTCYSRYSCHQCRRRHHTLLHQLNSLQVNTAQASEDSINIQSSLTSVNDSTEVPHNIQSYHANVQSPSTSIQHINKEKPNFHALLPTAVVQVRDNQGNSHLCRVLLDCGSQASFIAESFVQRLQIARYNARIPISGLASNNTTTKGWTSVMISARGDNLNYFKVNVLIVPQVTSSIPHKMIDVSKWGLADNLPLADPNYNHPANIDMLIGADHFFNILKDGRRSGTVGSIVAQNTIFGWVISGDVEGNQSNSSTYFSDSIANYNIHCNIDEILKNFWEHEEVEATTPQCIAKDECETHYVQNFSRDTTGRYVVKLPFKQDHKPLGYTSNIAISRLKSIERKLNKDLDLKEEYKTFMQEYQDLGHMEPLKHDEIYQCPENHYYLPHHAVIKCNSSTTKVRVVFDASCKSTSGVSLNDNLMVGPTIQNDLQTVLLQFRKFKIAFSSDIEKMYRQIRIASEDANFQRIVWRENSDSPIHHFKLTTVTYGTASAPYLAIRTLQQLAIDYASEYSLAAEIILKGFYVDDVLFGAETEEEAIQLKDQLIKLLSQGHFILRKWRSNSTKLINTIPEELQSTVNTASFEDNKSEKILGLQWNPVTDNFSFQVVESSNLSPTKRSFLSEAARIFDPLGWLAPATITVKIMFQQLWVQRIGWDDVLPEHLKKRWLALRDEFSEFEKLKIPRCINHFNNLIQLHCFSDASEVAYSAVIYCRDQDENGDTNVRLIASKTKVAPLKQISLPRLELCGAHLLAKLLKRIQTTLNYTDAKCYAWTDSTVVLGWLSDHPSRWKTYIANRTLQILDIIPSNNWNHVKSSDNPADHASRGVYPHKLLHLEQWWNGPSWLHQPESTWPINNNYCVDNIALREEERPNSTLFNHVKTLTTVIEELMSKISSYPKLLRILCYCSRFCHNIRAKRNNLPINTSYLKREELSHANNLCITWAQNTEFQQEITELLQQKQLSSKNKLISLAPFVDRDGVLRVGGRLENADCSYDSKHPIILPKSHPFSNMIIEYTHLKYFHPGPTLLFHLIRQKFWIIDAKNLIRHHVRKCVVCIRYKGQTSRQLMGNLPTSRVNPARAFSSCGVDYAGPIMLARKKGRGARLIKGYICVFVCFITKAVHLEVVSDLTTEAFLAALRRFIARRGIPSDIYSDNATNFVGAKRKLPELYGLIHNSHHNQKISDYLTINGTNWHLIPPAAPNFGGLWESSVKSVKHHLLRSTLNSHFTFEEMSTFLCQIEAILNSRPLTAINSDSSNIDVLTPGHFLMLTAPTALPENGLENVPISRLSRWQNIQQRVSGLWKRYQQEYLNSLQQRHKWKTTQDNLKEGDVVLVKEDNLPPCQWALAKITELHPGTDGLVRVVTLKTSTSVIKRALSKICKLPVN